MMQRSILLVPDVTENRIDHHRAPRGWQREAAEQSAAFLLEETIGFQIVSSECDLKSSGNI
jgi:hypothetical protein